MKNQIMTPEHADVFKQLVHLREEAGFTLNHHEYFSLDIEIMRTNIRHYQELQMGLMLLRDIEGEKQNATN